MAKEHREHTTITLPKPMLNRLRKLAEEDKRTASSIIEIALERLFIARSVGQREQPKALKTYSG